MAQKKKNSGKNKSQNLAVEAAAPSVAVSRPSETSSIYRSPAMRYPLPAVSWYEVIATGFFTGYLPKIPGTWGSLAALLLFALVAKFVPEQGLISVGVFTVSWLSLVMGILFTAIGIYAANILSKEWRSKDPGEIVIDEFAGFFLAMLLATPTWVGLIAAFVFFRLFDILKPGPVRSLQNLADGYGIVLDDVLAGIFASPCALLVERVALRWL